MCVFKYHAFIFLIRPPRWQRETDGIGPNAILTSPLFLSPFFLFFQVFKFSRFLSSPFHTFFYRNDIGSDGGPIFLCTKILRQTSWCRDKLTHTWRAASVLCRTLLSSAPTRSTWWPRPSGPHQLSATWLCNIKGGPTLLQSSVSDNNIWASNL